MPPHARSVSALRGVRFDSAPLPHDHHHEETTMAKTTTTNEPTEPTEEEGARAFSHALRMIGDGDLHDDAGVKLRELLTECAAYTERFESDAKGSLTLVIQVKTHPNGSVAVTGEAKIKAPSRPKAGSTFWLTKSHNLTADNPRQQKLPLREVPGGRREVKDLGSDDRTLRGV